MPDQADIRDFLYMISSDAAELSESIRKDTGRFVEKQINEAEKQALAESYDMIKTEVTKIRAEAGMYLTESRIKADKQLLINRSRIKDGVFEKVREKIEDFTASDRYPEFLRKSFEKCREAVGGNKFIVSLREKDRIHDGVFSGTWELEIRTDGAIKLGGIKVTNVSGDLTADDTLDTRLERQDEWFYKNSGLVINKSIE